jgi:hypothetical protein
MHSKNIHSSRLLADIEVLLDGSPVGISEQRRSLTGIRALLEKLALQKRRVLCGLRIDGEAMDVTHPLPSRRFFIRVEAQSMDINDMPLQMLRTAMRQTAEAQQLVRSAVVLVLINDGKTAREFWWTLARTLKEPLISLSLVPTSSFVAPHGVASFSQLRQWQLEQLGAILENVDAACWAEDVTALSNVLEHRALPWLEALERSLNLWHETLLAAARVQVHEWQPAAETLAPKR